MNVPANARVTGVTLNPRNPPALAAFYAKLLGWEIGGNEETCVTLPIPDGDMGLAFHMEDVYQRQSGRLNPASRSCRCTW